MKRKIVSCLLVFVFVFSLAAPFSPISESVYAAEVGAEIPAIDVIYDTDSIDAWNNRISAGSIVSGLTSMIFWQRVQNSSESFTFGSVDSLSTIFGLCIAGLFKLLGGLIRS